KLQAATSGAASLTLQPSLLSSSTGLTPDMPPPPSTAFFLSYPLWMSATFSFFIGFTIGILLFFLWWSVVRLSRFVVHRRTLSRILAEEQAPANAASVFSPMLRHPDTIPFFQHLQHEGLPFLAQIIGRGGCGEVYKAEIFVENRTIPVAIKKIDHLAATGAASVCQEESELLNIHTRQIRSEILTVGRMRHPSLLPLLAHVPKPDCHYLVYEYMPNGSLHDVLKQRSLQWPVRYKIALGIAAGLEYLHMVHRPQVIHRDLKPANILLDCNLNARIGDFGLAKVVHEMMSGPVASNNVAGTLGYIAPEYYQTMTCTAKCDMYSFGVILAVLVTGRFPSDQFFQATDEMCIVGWLRNVLRSADPAAAIDWRLMGNGFEEQMLLVLKVAYFCTYDDPAERPNSRDVKLMLSQIKPY
ncbi:unnamed protein product, partial [Musa banksii]